MKKNILLCNDDGINTEGIKHACRALSRVANVYVVAPFEQQSAKSQSISFRKDLKLKETDMKGATEAWAFEGTPCDCVVWGLQFYRNRGIAIDYVVGGINHGGNTGAAAYYSGTVAVAREGVLQGIKGIALSVFSHEPEYFEYLCNMSEDILRLADDMEPGYVLNVNAPNIPSWKIKGAKIVPPADFGFAERYIFARNEENEYRIHIEVNPSDPYAENDYNCVQDGYVAITPLRVGIKDLREIRQLQRLSDSRALCLFIDFQEKLVPAMKKSGALMRNVCKFARCTDRLELPVLVTTQYAKGLGDICPELADALGNYENVEKLSFSCMDSEAFRHKMEGLTMKTVILAGIESHICLEMTALDLVAEGYRVYVLEDCCSARSRNSHELAMRRLRDAGCIITSWESLVYSILGSSTHNAFRAISDIVKED